MKRFLLASLVALLASPAGAQLSDLGPFQSPYDAGIRMDSRFPIHEKINAGITDQIVAFEDFNQDYAVASCPFVDGTTDLEWENAGWTITAVGAPTSCILENSVSTPSTFFISPGTLANTGFNATFARAGRPTIAAATQAIHHHDVVPNWLVAAPMQLSWATRIGLGTTDDTFTWTSGVFAGLVEIDGTVPYDTALLNPATMALSVAGTPSGCFFHIAATGVLTFHCADGTDVNAAANCATVNLGDVLETNPHDSGNYPVYVDLGFSVDVPSTTGTGTAQAYYRILEQTPTPQPVPQWTTFCDPITGANIPNGADFMAPAYEIVQGTAGDQVRLGIEWIASALTRQSRTGCPGGAC